MSSNGQQRPFKMPHPVSVAFKPGPYHTDDSLVETRPAGRMGRGIFAAKNMSAGTRILSEMPLIMVPGNPMQRTLAENIAAFCNAALQINLDALMPLLNLSRDDSIADDPQTTEAVQNWLKQSHPKETFTLGWGVLQYSRLFSVYQRHAVGLPGLDASGVFYRHGVINHSCSPNAHAYYDPVKERHQVHLVREVKAGDQIFVSYALGYELPRAYRHAEILMQGHKFVCDCTQCTSQEAEAIMQRVPALYRGLSDYLKRANVKICQTNSTLIPRNESMEALAIAEELLSLLRHPCVDIGGPALGFALQFCSWVHQKLGNINSAAMYARERLALQVRLYGFEAENFLDDDDAATKLHSIEKKLSRMEAGGP